MAFNFYKSYLRSIAKQPVDEWRQITQATIDDTWLNTSTLENVLGQKELGTKTYKKESIQLNSVIDPKTGNSFGDEYRKIVYKTLKDNYISEELETTDRFLGKYYQFYNFTWITINTNTIIGSMASAILQRCNNWLKWYDNKQILHEWPCVFERSLGSTGLNRGSEGVAEVGADITIKVQRNEATDTIPYNQRFIFDGHAFQVKQINNHISNTYMEIYLFETQVQSNDDLVNNIANSFVPYQDTTTKIIITPVINSLLQGVRQEFSVYNYMGGKQLEDTFIVETSGPALNVNYSIEIIDGNHFSITNLLQSDLPLSITCTSEQDNNKQILDIILGGGW